MALYIRESFARAGKKITCDVCGRVVYYYDRLSDDSISCLRCSYEDQLKPTPDCVFNAKEFDPTDEEMLSDMLGICEIDVQNAPEANAVTIKLPDDLKDPLAKLMLRHKSTLNAEIVAALGWYATVCLSNPPVDFTSIETSVSTDVPEELSLHSTATEIGDV